MKARISWLDNLKALGIFLVIWGHMLPDSYLKQYIYSFHVPLFFFASGYVFNRSKYNFGRFFKKKIRTLIIPYLFFAALSFSFWFFIVRNLSISGKALEIDPLRPLIGIFYGIGSEDWRVPMNTALWFLPCLFIVEIIYYSIRNKYLLLLFPIVGYAASFLVFRLPWGIDVAFTAVVFYGIGNLYKETWLTYKALPFLLVLHLVFCFSNDPVDMNNLTYGNMLYFYVSAFSGILFYLVLLRSVGKNMAFEYVGRNTIILIGLVGITWFIANGIYYLFSRMKMEQSGYGFTFAASIAQIILTVPAIYFINNWFPAILGRERHRIRTAIGT